MYTKNFNTPLLTILLGLFLLTSCKKGDDAALNGDDAAKPGMLTCKIDGKVYAHNGSGYVLEDNYSAVKAENGAEQFTVNFYGMKEGDYTVSNGPQTVGNAKLQYFTADNKVIYTAKSGLLKITKYQKTGGFKVSGTFSGKFEKFLNNQPTGEFIEVTEGSFTEVTLLDIRK